MVFIQFKVPNGLKAFGRAADAKSYHARFRPDTSVEWRLGRGYLEMEVEPNYEAASILEPMQSLLAPFIQTRKRKKERRVWIVACSSFPVEYILNRHQSLSDPPLPCNKCCP